MAADPTTVVDGAEVTVTATPAAEVVDEATAVSIARNILSVETVR